MNYNTWKLKIRPTSSFITPIQSDTLFGSMIWALKIRYGDGFVENIIEETRNYNPPFIFSNPIINGNYPIFGGLSNKFLDEIDDVKFKGFDRKRIEFYKALKKKKYVSKNVFEELLNGKKIEKIYLEVLDGVRDFSTLEKRKTPHNQKITEEFLEDILSGKKDENNKSYTIEGRIRNQINRLGNSKENDGDTRLFEQREIIFSKDTEIEIFVKIRKDFEMEKFEKGMRYISFNGYGRSASTGKGQFEIIGMEQEKGFEGRKNKNSFVILSNYIPNENDQVEVINSNIFTKKPKAYMTENPFKDYFICYNEGSYFKGNSEIVKGRVLENLKKDDNKNIQCLIPFVIGVDD